MSAHGEETETGTPAGPDGRYGGATRTETPAAGGTENEYEHGYGPDGEPGPGNPGAGAQAGPGADTDTGPGAEPGRWSGPGDGSVAGPGDSGRPRPDRRPLWIGLIVLVVIALGAYFAYGNGRMSPVPTPAVPVPVATVPLPANPPGAAPPAGAPAGSFTATGITTVELDGFAGNITVTATSANQITDTVQNGTPLGQVDKSTHTLRLFCAPGTCPSSDYVITIPEHVGLILHQTSGQTRLVGLSGPVDITADSANTVATGLLTSNFTAVITSGQLDASFAAAPARTAISVISASATVHLPANAAYAVSQQVASGNVQVAIPQDPDSPHAVDATITSGQINLVGS